MSILFIVIAVMFSVYILGILNDLDLLKDFWIIHYGLRHG